MNTETKITAVVEPIVPAGADPGVPGFLSLTQSAALEFHACVQLLAERARFLTAAAGAAVALDQDGQFVYCAAAGSMVSEIGATADITRHPLRKCIKTGQPVWRHIDPLPTQPSSKESHPALVVPVMQDQRVAGFFELSPGVCEFEDPEVEAVTRISAMLTTALDHLDAARKSESLIVESTPKSETQAAPAGPVLWHAPEPVASEPIPPETSRLSSPAEVRTCTACGFPVSGARTLCLDCEKHRDDPRPEPEADLNPPAEMFVLEQEESWISAHGYTIASLLVTALAAAIIFWLR